MRPAPTPRTTSSSSSPAARRSRSPSRPRSPVAPTHDAFTRFEPDPATLWAEVAPLLLADGVLSVLDTTLDKPYARRVDLVAPHWSGKHKAVVRGVNLVTAV